MVVHDSLKIQAECRSQKTAVICGDRSLTYGELEASANRLARALQEMGVRRGDRVAVFLPNSVETASAIYGVLNADAVFVPVNHGTKPAKLAYVLDNCDAVAVITDAARYGILTDALSLAGSRAKAIVIGTKDETVASPRPAYLWADIMASYDSLPPSSVAIDRDLACLIYTSGSTGEPKGIACGHDNVVFARDAIIAYLQNTSNDIVIGVLPFSFDYGLYQLLMTVAFGGTLVIENAFAFPAAILRSIEQHAVTGFPVVPTLSAMLLRSQSAEYDVSSLRYITNTAAALPPSHIQQLRLRFPRVSIYSMYGLTECKRALYLPPDRLDDKPSSVGVPIPGTETWVVDDAGFRMPPGEVGELVVRGSHVMRGYWNDDVLTSRIYRAGPTPGERVLYTGDLFRVDEEGLHYFVARKDDIIKSRGEKVSPKEVESSLCELSGVSEATVVGVEDEMLGQALVAYVVSSNQSLTERDVRAHCASRLESYMIPSRICFVDTLPRTSSGKVDRLILSGKKTVGDDGDDRHLGTDHE